MSYYRFTLEIPKANGEFTHSRSSSPMLSKDTPLKYFVYRCYTSEKDDCKTLYVSNLGHECDWPDKKVENIVNDRFIIHYVMRGEGYFNGMNVKAGQFFFTHPYEVYSISNNPDNPLEYYYIGVAGAWTQDIINQSLFSSIPKVNDFGFANEIPKLMSKLLYEKNDFLDFDFNFLSTFMKLLAYHRTENKRINEYTSNSDSYVYYRSALSYIQHYFKDAISPSDVCAYLHISPSYLRRIFSENCIYSAQELIIRKRLMCAISHIIFDNYTISKAADMVGYEDYAQFSKQFKKYIGMSPMAYKKKFIEEKQLLNIIDDSFDKKAT
ncbi:MAG: helix-turn-helix transcriptional regulator [Clostridia bacterium]|nr:helix-turn-helix transcriptional regulator [Clostridia bacterium]